MLMLMLASAAAYRPDYAYTFYKLASAAYCDEVESWSCAPCKASNQTVASVLLLFNKTTDTRAYIAAYQDLFTGHTSIVLSFRGSETLTNWIENLKIAKTDRDMSCAGCKVHSGFYGSWAPIATPVVAEIKRLQVVYPSARLYTTGHSLGAALAVLAAYVLEYDYGFSIAGVYTFGQPRVGNHAFASYYNNHSDTHVTWRVTHHHDPVVHLPLELMGFSHVGNEIFYDSDSPATTGYRVCDGSGEDSTCSDQYNLLLHISVYDHLHYFGETIGENGC